MKMEKTGYVPTQAANDVESKIFGLGKVLTESGWMPERAYENLEVSKRQSWNGKISSFRQPAQLVSDNSAKFTIYQDVLDSRIKEFDEHLEGPLDQDERRNLVTTYAAAVAVGEYALKRAYKDPSYTRSPKRFVLFADIMTDTSDFTDHFAERISDTDLKSLMSIIDDSALMEINGQRAGLTIVRAAAQDVYGMDFMSDKLTYSCNVALERYIDIIGPRYVGVSKYLHSTAKNGVNAFAYSIPEWLFVLGVPMGTTRLNELFSEKFVSVFPHQQSTWSDS